MSYSRWSNSDWYTYWLARKEPDCRLSTVLRIHHVASDNELDFQAAGIRKNVDACIDAVRAVHPTISEASLAELKGYMLEFLADVDARFPRVRP